MSAKGRYVSGVARAKKVVACVSAGTAGYAKTARETR